MQALNCEDCEAVMNNEVVHRVYLLQLITSWIMIQFAHFCPGRAIAREMCYLVRKLCASGVLQDTRRSGLSIKHHVQGAPIRK